VREREREKSVHKGYNIIIQRVRTYEPRRKVKLNSNRTHTHTHVYYVCIIYIHIHMGKQFNKTVCSHVLARTYLYMVSRKRLAPPPPRPLTRETCTHVPTGDVCVRAR
jgi:hypothetical protein